MWEREGFCSVLRWKSLEGVDMLMERRPSRGGSAEDPGEIGGPWLEVGKKMGRGEVGGGEGEGGGPGAGSKLGERGRTRQTNKPLCKCPWLYLQIRP